MTKVANSTTTRPRARHAAVKRVFQKFFAFTLTALMLFEMAPALAWAEVGEAVANAANELSLQADEAAREGETLAGEEATGDELGELEAEADAETGDPAESAPQEGEPAEGDDATGSDPSASENEVSTLATDEPVAIANGVAEIVGGSSYATLGEALKAATSKQTVRLTADYTLTEDVTVPSGVTLLVPCMDGDTGYASNGYAPNSDAAVPNPVLYRTLTVPAGKTITVADGGTMLVNAVVGGKQTVKYDPEIFGGYGRMLLEGTISVQSGGTFDSQGKTEGAGMVEVMSGGTARDVFATHNWRGGTAASNTYSDIYPINEYYSHTLAAKLRVWAGGTYAPTVVIYTDKIFKQFNYTQFKQVASDGIIRLQNGYVDKTFVPSSDGETANGKETYTFHGDVVFDSSSMKLKVFILNLDLTTGKYEYPWPGTYDFVFNGNKVSFNQSFKFLPGVTMTANGAELTIASGKTLVFYDTFNDTSANRPYPKNRPASKLVLNGDSKLVNEGAFAGNVVLNDGAYLQTVGNGSWGTSGKPVQIKYAEVDGSGNVTKRTTDHVLKREGYDTWREGANGELIWGTVDTAALQAAVDAAQGVKEQAAYVENTWGPFQTALNAAKALLADTTLGKDDQARVNAAAKALTDAQGKLELETFTVTLDPGKGSLGGASDTITKRYGETLAASELPKLTRDGYSFLGWYEGDEQVSELANIQANHELTAQWKALDFKITYEGLDGEGITWPEGASSNPNPTSFTIEEDVTIKNPERVGYAFDGWIVGSGSPVQSVSWKAGEKNGPVTLTAKWTVKTFTVTFDADGGTLYSEKGGTKLDAGYSVKATYGQQYPALPYAEKLGYKDFTWKIQGTNTPVKAGDLVAITSDVVLKASYTLSDYSLHYELADGEWEDGGTWAKEHGTYTVNTPTFELPVPKRTGYTFLGWDRGTGTPEPKAQVTEGTTGDITFTACWKLNSYNLTFKADGGTFAGDRAETAITRNHFATVGTIPEVSRLGYELTGWEDSKGAVRSAADTSALEVSGDETFTAQWQLVTYTITVNLADGESWADGESPAESYTVVSEATTLPTPQKLGHAFTGWRVSGNLSGDATALEAGTIKPGTTGNLEFTPAWKAANYTITWNLFPGEDAVTESVPFGTEVTRTLGTRQGYEFRGWTVEPTVAELNASGLPEAMPASDLTITATWENYLETLNGLTGDLSALKADASRLTQARSIYNTKLNPTQKASYNTANLFEAIRAAENATIAQAVSAKLGDTNKTLIQDGKAVAELHEGEATEAGLRTLYVEIKDPKFLAKNMLTINFLEELFSYDGVAKVNINGKLVSKDQMQLMLAVAYATLGDEMGMTEDQFKNWLVSQVNDLTIGSLSGSSVPATLVGATTKEGVHGEVGYLVRFYEANHPVDWVDYKTLEFNSQGGSSVTAYQKKAGVPIEAPEAPTRQGYDFTGWFKDAACTEPFTFASMPAQSTTVYAGWRAHEYRVAFALGEGDGISGPVPAEVNAAYDVDLTIPVCGATRTGYRFTGWASDAGEVYKPGQLGVRNLTAKDGETVALTAQWEAQSYPVTLDATPGAFEDGKQTKTITLTYDGAYGDLPEPTRAGYDFVNWTLDGTPVTGKTTVKTAEAHTLVATWNAQGDTPYTVKVYQQNVDGNGYTEVSSEKKTSATDSTVTAQAEHVLGFTVNDDLSTTSGQVKADGSLELSLYYDREVYEITFEVEGRAPETRQVRYGAEIEAPNPERTDDSAASYQFTGWEPEVPATAEPSVDRQTYKATYRELYEVSVLPAEEGADGATYRTLELALATAKSGETLVLAQDVELAKDTSIPRGVTLIVPFEEDDTGYVPNYMGEPFNPSNDKLNGKLGPAADPEPYRTLTVAKTATLKVDGTLLVNALTGRPRAANYDQDVTGGWGLLQANGRVLVSAGGTFECFGFTRGTGSVRALAGGTVGDLFLVRSWRGGSQALAMYGENVYPYNEYDCKSIEVPVTIEAGGTLMGLVKMYASDAYYSTRFPLIDPANGLMRQNGYTLGEHKVVRTVTPTSEHYEVIGDTTFSRSTLVIVGEQLSTGEFIYPIDGDISWTLASGSFDFDDDYKFLTGSSVEAKNANLTVNPGKTVVFYSEFNDPENLDGTTYPKRPAATLSLDARSSFVNYGTFAGEIYAEEPTVEEGRMEVAWEAQTREANGSYKGKYGNESIAIDHELDITCPGHTWEVSKLGEILWDGEKSKGTGQQILEVTDEVAEEISKEPGLQVTPEVAEDGEVTWIIDVTGQGLSKPAEETSDTIIGAFLRAMAERYENVEKVSTVTGELPEEVAYLARGVAQSTVDRFVKKLGLVDAAERNAHLRFEALGSTLDAGAEQATAADLAGASCKLMVTSADEVPVNVTFTLKFTAEGEVPVRPVSVYRVFNKVTGEHLFTVDANEAKTLSTTYEKDGWVDEGVAWISPSTSATTVTRLFNMKTGEHLYSKDPNEVLTLCDTYATDGWTNEGIAWYSADAKTGTPVYRLFSASQKAKASHHYTKDVNEYRTLPSHGWTQEKVCWYGLPTTAETAGSTS